MSQSRILLLGPGNSSHTLEWRRVLAELGGACILASMHPCLPDDRDRDQVVLLDGAETRGPLRPIRLLRAARRLLEAQRFDVVLAYYMTSYGLLASFAAPGRYLAVGAGSDLFPQSLRTIRRMAAARALRHAAGGVAWTSIMARRMHELGLRPGRMRVGPRGIDLGDFFPREAGGRDDAALRVISTRRLRPLFHLDRLVEAVGGLVRAGRDVRLELVGEGSERSKLERLVGESGLGETVTLSGSLPKPQVAERLRTADIFVSLSDSDGLSASLLEAMACGLLPVLSDIPANREVVVHGENGLLVRVDAAEEIRQALERAHDDRELRERARRQNVTTARERFDIRRNTASLLATAREWSQPV